MIGTHQVLIGPGWACSAELYRELPDESSWFF